jgi:hypothetical protein
MSLYIARGNEISWELSFLDANRQPMSPTSVVLRVSYKVDGIRTTASIPMTSPGGGVFKATWKSHVADPGIIDWHVSTDDNVAAEDGSFQLIANNANPST